MEPAIKKLKNNITLIADGEHIVCDKSKLIAASSYFRAMFESDMKESVASEINLKSVDGSLLRTLVDFAQNERNELELINGSVQALLQLACMLQFNNAIDVIERYLLDNITCSNCCSIMIVSDMCGLNTLYNKARMTTEWYFDEVSQTDEFASLPFDICSDLVSSNTLHIASEYVVVKSVERWLMYDVSGRFQHLPALMSHVHWKALSEISFDDFTETSVICKDEGAKKEITKIRKQQIENETNVQQRSPPEAVVVLGGEWMKADQAEDEDQSENKDNTFNQHLLVYDDERSDSTSYALTSLPDDYSNIWGYESCVVGKDLYLIGGEKKGLHMKDWYKSVWCYDSLKNTWKVVTSIATPRRHHSLAVCGEFIYVIGGFSRYRIIQNTVDRYDTVKGTWQRQPPLEHTVFSAAACSCNGNVYVMTNNVEILYSESKKWKQKPDLLPRNVSIQCAVAHGSNIYMLALYMKCFYLLDSITEQVTTLDSFWQTIGKACVTKDRICIVGGEDDLCMEYYSFPERSFGMAHSKLPPLKDHHVLALPKYPAFRKTKAHAVNQN